MLNQTELENAIWGATMLVLNGEIPTASDTAAQKRVRISWNKSPYDNSNWERDEDVCFLRITPFADGYTPYEDITHLEQNNSLKEVVKRHVSYDVTWVNYGPNAWYYAEMIRGGLFRQKVSEYLAGFQVAFMPQIQAPVSLNEQDENGEWWTRCDLRAQFYELVTSMYSEDCIAGLGDININTETKVRDSNKGV